MHIHLHYRHVCMCIHVCTSACQSVCVHVWLMYELPNYCPQMIYNYTLLCGQKDHYTSMGAILPWLRRNPPKIWLITVVSLLNLSSLGKQNPQSLFSIKISTGSLASTKTVFKPSPLNTFCLGNTTTNSVYLADRGLAHCQIVRKYCIFRVPYIF